MVPKNIHRIAEDSARGGIFLVAGAIFTIVGYAISSIIVARMLGTRDLWSVHPFTDHNTNAFFIR